MANMDRINKILGMKVEQIKLEQEIRAELRRCSENELVWLNPAIKSIQESKPDRRRYPTPIEERLQVIQ